MPKRPHLTITEDAPTDTGRRAGRAARPPKPRPRRSRRTPAELAARAARWNRGLRLFALAGFVAEAGVLLLANPYFHVTKVQVEGTQTLTASQVAEEANVPARTNIFAMLRQPFVKRMEQDPVVDHATRSIRLPNTLVLTVTERRPRAVLAAQGQFWLLDPKGVPYRQIAAPVRGLPTVQVASAVLPETMPLGQPIHAVWMADVSRLLSLLDASPELSRTLGGVKTGGAKITVDQNLNLCLNRRDQLQIRLGQSDSLPRKMALADAAVSAYGGALARQASYIDVSCPQQPVWRPRTDTHGHHSESETTQDTREITTHGPDSRTD